MFHIFLRISSLSICIASVEISVEVTKRVCNKNLYDSNFHLSLHSSTQGNKDNVPVSSQFVPLFPFSQRQTYCPN